MLECECGRKFNTPQGLGYHKKFCGNYKIFLDGGYECRIGEDGKRVYIHREVMEKKLGRKLRPGEISHHIDDNKRNNNPDNLELKSNLSDHTLYHYSKWSEDRKNSFKNCKSRQAGSKNGQSKLIEADVIDIRTRLQNGEIGANLSVEYKVDATLISQIKNMKIWKHVEI